jgi:hypothetical protein
VLVRSATHVTNKSTLTVIFFTNPIKFFVPEDCPTLEMAVERAKGIGEDITTIRLAKGIHEVEEDEVNITDGLPITIVGAGKNETIIQGGVFLISGGDVNSTTKEVLLQDMTIRKTKMNGVFNRGGLPLRMVDVAMDACGWSGVVVMHGARADCTNVTVSKCRFSGFVAYDGGNITLRGDRTSVTENATDENGAGYGLDACGSSSVITLVSPLTKERVSRNNGGGRNLDTENGGKIVEYE